MTPDRQRSGAPDAMGRLSLNQWTTRNWTVPEAVAGCARHGIGAIGLWREHVADFGLEGTARLVTETGLRVSSLCRGGFFGRPGWLEDNRAAVDEAAALGASCLVLVAGGLPADFPDNSKKLPQVRGHVADALAALVPYARDRGVRLAIEPMHPVYCADRGVVSTLRQALDLAAPYEAETVGVVVDTFHLWWDPDLETQIADAGEQDRIASYQVSDFLCPLPADVLLGRAMMGDGVIDFGPFTGAVASTGYAGDVEVEIFNADVWAADPDRVLATMKERYASLVAPFLSCSSSWLGSAGIIVSARQSPTDHPPDKCHGRPGPKTLA
jgi:sugar phosphate isomerase/epimerase